MNVPALENALRTWIVGTVGLAADKVIFGDQGAPSGAPAKFITVELGDSRMVGLADPVVQTYDAGGAPGAEVVFTTRGLREMTVALQAFSPTTTEASSSADTARTLLQKCQASLSLPSVRRTLNAAGIGVNDVGDVHWVPGIANTEFEGRALLELLITVGETAEDRNGYIASVDVTTNVTE